MRSFWSIAVMISVLFMSVDGAADTAINGHAHGDGAYHQDNDHPAHPDQTSDTEGAGDHCERCCHGHTAGITSQVAAIKTPFVAGSHEPSRSPRVRNVAKAPPTPPPTA